ncbi:hypothetical protein AAEH77_00125 [Shewanella xiamenensis]|uniref:hypothetical protein n=1 Tax=Shewanella xiamenensis TaxID=332186 RepID=UPI00313E338C
MQCVLINPDGSLVADLSATNCQYVLLTEQDYKDVSNQQLIETLNDLFAFDFELFAELNGFLLLSFLFAHGIGRLTRTLGKH